MGAYSKTDHGSFYIFMGPLKTILRLFLKILAALVILVISLISIYLWINRTNGRIESSGQTRKYLLYVPDSYDPSTPTPLVISLHGFIEWPAHLMNVSHWNDVADEYGFLVVYPSGTGLPLRWHTRNWPGSGMTPEEEVQFISDLIDHLGNLYNIDPNRIYANGFSNGAGMSYLLACQLSERIAAMGGVAGAYHLPWDECQTSRPVPIIAFHGTGDPIVPYEGGDPARHTSTLPNLPAWILEWVQRNDCDPTPVELPTTGNVSGVQYVQPEDKGDVVFYSIEGGGHQWPGGEAVLEFIAGRPIQDIDATRVMWDFFRKYSLED
jgi:polyhydroxybutyrate depolymerase